MPWKECSVLEERLRFVARLLEGEAMSEVCREFGVSRKTGYKIYKRYKAHGLEDLSDRSRRPVRYANQLPAPIEALIVRFKQEKPHWGARKISELLVRRLDGDVQRLGIKEVDDGIWLVSFRTIRGRVFPGDTRRLMDMRRSGAVEASAGGVDPNAHAAKMANTINRSQALQRTYQPVSLAAVQVADEARRVGRRRIRDSV